MKARQLGFTTYYCIDYLDEALWTPGMSCAILSHERSANTKIFEIVKRGYENLPDQLKPKARYDTKTSLSFVEMYNGIPLDSSIYVDLKLRGGTVQKLHITESAYIKDRNELNAGSKQAVPISGFISEETTANGFNEFFDFYSESANNPNPDELDYKTYFYPWFINPEYSLTLANELSDKSESEIELQNKYQLTDGQLAWRRWKMKELKKEQVGLGLSGEQLFKQEYPSTVSEAFQSGSGNVFDAEKVDNVTPAPFIISTADIAKKGVTIWQEPITKTDKTNEHKYVIGVDPSGGDSSDYSCIDVWDKDSLIQVAQYYGMLRPDELAELTKEVAEYYNNAFVGVENNMLSTILFLSKIYDNYFFTTRIDEKTAKKTKKVGWNTNIKTRDVMIDEFIILFDEGHLTINSKITLNQMKTFVKKENGKREHADGKNDDALIAGMIAMQMRKHFRDKLRVFRRKPAGF